MRLLILDQAHICNPLAPNISADIGLEDFECILEYRKNRPLSGLVFIFSHFDPI